MLSSIGRAAIRRAGAGASQQSTNRVFQCLWHTQRVREPKNANQSFDFRQSSLALRRAYATATKATKPAPKTSTKAKAKPKSRKLATKKKPAKKPVKKAVKKKPVKKAAAKTKPKKKVLTDEQKAKKALAKEKAELKALKATALTPPKVKPTSAWTVLFSEYMTETKIASGGSAAGASAKFKNLSVSELENYNHKANQNKDANEVAYKKWIDSHTPEEIRLANNARKSLKRMGVKGADAKHSKKYPLLMDPRLPKRPSPAWTLFVTSRWQSGDFKGINITDATKQIMKEWRALPASERKVFEDQNVADRNRYIQEFKTVFGRDPSSTQTTEEAV